MKQLNIPSYSSLIQRDRIIKSIIDLYEYINKFVTEIENNYVPKDMVLYEDVYVGVGAAYTDVMTDDYHHDSLVKGRPIAFDTVDGYIWVILPESYTPVVAMSLVEVPMSVDSTTTAVGVNYKIWKSEESQSGSFNIYLF